MSFNSGGSEGGVVSPPQQGLGKVFFIFSHLCLKNMLFESEKIWLFSGKGKEWLIKEEKQCFSKILSWNYFTLKYTLLGILAQIGKWHVCRAFFSSWLILLVPRRHRYIDLVLCSFIRLVQSYLRFTLTKKWITAFSFFSAVRTLLVLFPEN